LVIALDGVSARSFEQFSIWLPKAVALLRQCEFSVLTTAPLTSAQAIWAELLTGSPWWENACAGFARPRSSLNHLDVFTEADLQQPVTVLPNGLNVVVNTPLLQPNDSNRIWFSDGSSSRTRVISPAALATQHAFNDYQPRAYSSVIEMLSDPVKALDQCLNTESRRLECATKLMETCDWQMCLLRISLFDQLEHLLGPGVDWTGNLTCADKILSFMKELDAMLSFHLQQPEEKDVWLISCFSHVPCRGRVSLNRILRESRFTELMSEPTNANESSARRNAALSALSSTVRVPDRVRWSEGMLATGKTLAASPMSGCVFINDTQRFTDGVVETEDFERLRDRAAKHVSERLNAIAPGATSIFVNPSPRSTNCPVPDIVVEGKGIEFVDVEDPRMSDRDKPRSTHAAEGFVFFPASRSGECYDEITPIQLHNILKCGQ